jgi:hypothetical protein
MPTSVELAAISAKLPKVSERKRKEAEELADRFGFAPLCWVEPGKNSERTKPQPGGGGHNCLAHLIAHIRNEKP